MPIAPPASPDAPSNKPLRLVTLTNALIAFLTTIWNDLGRIPTRKPLIKLYPTKLVVELSNLAVGAKIAQFQCPSAR